MILRSFWLVLVDLWDFLFATTRREFEHTLQAPISPLRLRGQGVDAGLLLPPTTNAAQDPTPLKEPFVNLPSEAVSSGVLLRSQRQYVADPQGVLLLTLPQFDFDVAQMVLPYGQLVLVERYVGPYAAVQSKTGSGYVHKDSLTPVEKEVWPHFEAGTTYTQSSAETVRTRLLINDTFLAGRLLLPLQAGEYILVRLMRDQHHIAWPNERPRLAGRWHHMLKGVRGIKTGVIPLTDTIMEWTAEDGIGRLAYVEAVFPDQAVRVTGVGLMVPGEYSELTFKPDTWREWRPVFISVSS